MWWFFFYAFFYDAIHLFRCFFFLVSLHRSYNLSYHGPPFLFPSSHAPSPAHTQEGWGGEFVGIAAKRGVQIYISLHTFCNTCRTTHVYVLAREILRLSCADFRKFCPRLLFLPKFSAEPANSNSAVVCNSRPLAQHLRWLLVTTRRVHLVLGLGIGHPM
jgi:hypothetical protein